MSATTAAEKVATVFRLDAGDRFRVEIKPRTTGRQPWDLIDQLGGTTVIAFKSAPMGCAFETRRRDIMDRLLALLAAQGYRIRRSDEP